MSGCDGCKACSPGKGSGIKGADYTIALAGNANVGKSEILTSSRVFSLLFIPVALERYELRMSKQMYEKDSPIRAIFDMNASQQFKGEVIHLGGYETDNTGMIHRCRKTK